jgi:anti-anti-sigma factor
VNPLQAGQARSEGGITIITLSEDGIEGEIAQPREAVKGVLREGALIHLDMGAVTHLDSIRLGQLMMCHTTAANAGAKLVLINVSESVRSVLTAMSLHRILETG